MAGVDGGRVDDRGGYGDWSYGGGGAVWGRRPCGGDGGSGDDPGGGGADGYRVVSGWGGDDDGGIEMSMGGGRREDGQGRRGDVVNAPTGGHGDRGGGGHGGGGVVCQPSSDSRWSDRAAGWLDDAMDRRNVAHGGTEVGAPVAGMSVMPWLDGAAVAAAPAAAAARGAEVFVGSADTAAVAVLGELQSGDNLGGVPYVAGTSVGVAAAPHMDGTPVVHPIAAAQDGTATIAMPPAVVAEVVAAAGAAATKGAASASAAYWSSRRLRRHIAALHNPERPVMCHFCGRRFADQYTRRCHVRDEHERRTAEGLLGCHECTKTFKTMSSLRWHWSSTHNGNQRYECMARGCGQRYVYRKDAIRHWSRRHASVSLALQAARAGAPGCGGARRRRRACRLEGAHRRGATPWRWRPRRDRPVVSGAAARPSALLARTAPAHGGRRRRRPRAVAVAAPRDSRCRRRLC